MAKPDFQPKISYVPKLDHLTVVNVEAVSTLKGQKFDRNTFGFWKGKRLVALSMTQASYHLRGFMAEQGLNSLEDLPTTLDKIGDEKNMSRRGAARRFINDVLNGSGFDEYRNPFNNSSI